MSHTYDYPRPAVTVDCAVFGWTEPDHLQLLLIERGGEPFAGAWALPGGFVGMDETLDEAAARELAEESGLRDPYLEQLYTFGDVDRDPRGRVITVAYSALVRGDAERLEAKTDASDARWFDLDALPKLAFDHAEIIDVAVTRLRGKITYQPVGFELLPETFTLTQLQQLYETILGRELDKRNFRKKVLAMNLLEDTGETVAGVAHRAPRLYRFDRARYDELTSGGLEFRLR